MTELWASGATYEPYVGRWSRLVAPRFVDWLALPVGCRWVDVGCGTGALTAAILERAQPVSVVAVDPSPAHVDWARERQPDPRVEFRVGTLDVAAGTQAHAVVSGLVLNFLPDISAAVDAMRGLAPGGVVAAYVWDYGGSMQLMRYFWDAAIMLDSRAAALDESARFAICAPDRLTDLWVTTGLTEVACDPIDVPTLFCSFDDYWEPFLHAHAPAPAYAQGLPDGARTELRELLRTELPTADDGTIALTARAWAVRGRVAP